MKLSLSMEMERKVSKFLESPKFNKWVNIRRAHHLSVIRTQERMTGTIRYKGLRPLTMDSTLTIVNNQISVIIALTIITRKKKYKVANIRIIHSN